MQLQASSVGPPADDFNDLMMDQVRKAPWFLLSTVMHGMVFAIVLLLRTEDIQAKELVNLSVAMEDEEVPQEIVEPEVPELVEPVETSTEIETEVPQVDHDVTDDTQQAEDFGEAEALGDEGEMSDVPSAVGLGGGQLGGGLGNGKGHGHGAKPSGAPYQRQLELALDWLKRHQHANGHWDGDAFEARKGEPHAKDCRCCHESKASPLHDVGLTGLALLAYLGAGETSRGGRYAKTVSAGLLWLISRQNDEGRFGGEHHAFTYDQAIASLAMIEAYGMTRNPAFEFSAKKALAYCLRCQTPYAGWRYHEGGPDTDTSVTGWMIMALKSARLAGLEVDQRAFDWALAWVDKMTDESTGRTGYISRGAVSVRESNLREAFPGSESESMTAAGIVVRVFSGQDPESESSVKLGQQLLSESLPVWDPARGCIDMYYWYYGTLAAFQVGGRTWNSWNRAIKRAMVDTQRTDGCASGSWDPIGAWGGQGGRVYSTALMALCLEVYYRYPRVFGAR